jgi:peptidoglycan/xylan/chitin deacetylase (PgdA/CDA1 family)
VTSTVVRRISAPAVVLAYHGVGNADEAVDRDKLMLAPQLFEEHLDFLTRRGYTFHRATDLDADRPPDPGTVVLTFDDGLRDGITEVLPRLRARGVTATFFVNPSLLGRTHDLLPGPSGALFEADDLTTLVDAGMEVGSHALAHDDLRRLDDDALVGSLRESKARIEAITGQPCRTLAYPFGLHDARVRRAASAAGYQLAFAWRPGPWDPMAVPRLPAPARHGARRLGLKLLGIRRRAR